MTAEIKVAYDERGIPYLFEATGEEAVKVNMVLEKQIPKKPYARDLWELGTAIGYSCPCCGYEFPVNYTEPCCNKCGQALDWSDNE